ncbi:MAG TPA: UbiA family prenyltransferase, partial [Longimicrobiales bacterium]|nr:UbiA family prenyltransferase [Longimicrobiales bacterium]
MPVTTTNPTTAAPASRATIRTVLGDLFTLSKPGITRLVLFTTAAGYLMAAGVGSDLVRLFHTLLGTGLATASANALNMWWERDSDRHMDRTSTRPLPAGRLPASGVLGLGILVGVLGLGHLAYWVTPLTVALVAASLLS